MKLCLTLNHRFYQTPDGRVWTITQCPYNFYSEYLDVFDSVRVIARSFQVPAVKPTYLAVDGPGVEFHSVVGYKGPLEFMRRYRSVRHSIRDAVPNGAAVVFRVPSQIANSVEAVLRQNNHPYAIDVVADPFDVLSPQANPHPLAPVARFYYTHHLKSRVKRAIAINYVTKSYLQKRYPARRDAIVCPPLGSELDECAYDGTRQYVVAASDANLPEEHFVDAPRTRLRENGVLKALFIGTLESLYKGPDTLIRAVAECKNHGVPIQLRFAGSGKETEALKALACTLGVGNCVTFLGDVQVGASIQAEIDRADVFVLPSRAEGVPRAMLEAMARCAPCLGSHAGGIPELLPEEDRTSPEDYVALAGKLREVFGDSERINRMSIRNFKTARMYATQSLRARRRRFLEAVRQRTADHFDLARRHVSAMQINTY